MDLSRNQLSGEIPSELGSLSNLRRLDLSRNQLSGEIPSELGSLSNLVWLGLYVNRLSGAMPSELGSLSNLRGLELGFNQLSGEIPPELGSLSNLGGLELGFNQLSGEIPSELGSLSNLVWLGLYGNQLSGEIPSELGSLSNLEVLRLDDNSSLSGPLPGSFTGLTLLSSLSLSGTGLCAPTDAAFQAWLGGIGDRRGVVNCLELTDRDALVALYNAADGDNWVNKDNWLSDRPLGEWHGVRTDGNGPVTGLYLNDNRLRGEIPPELGSLANLGRLHLFTNQLSGEIPPELGSLSNLRELYLYQNQLSGEIPPELGSLSNLGELYLYQNQLSGEIPPELGSLSNLRQLRLSGNSSLSGPLPGSFTGLTLLTHLSLSGTQLCVPADAAFQAWLRGIGDRVGIVNCGSDSLIARYDANQNGTIERSEVIAAIRDYLDGAAGITRAEVIRLINLYLFG